jgi:hypothetical protein
MIQTNKFTRDNEIVKIQFPAPSCNQTTETILKDTPSVTVKKVNPHYVTISPKTPRTPRTSRASLLKCDALGFIYGSPITSLKFGRKPTKIEVVQLYMHLYDEVSCVPEMNLAFRGLKLGNFVQMSPDKKITARALLL